MAAGITTGQLLCACVGSKARLEYTVYGDAINLSARLMMKAKEVGGGILCDYSTSRLASKAATFHRLEPLQVRKALFRFPNVVLVAINPFQDAKFRISKHVVGHKDLSADTT